MKFQFQEKNLVGKNMKNFNQFIISYKKSFLFKSSGEEKILACWLMKIGKNL